MALKAMQTGPDDPRFRALGWGEDPVPRRVPLCENVPPVKTPNTKRAGRASRLRTVLAAGAAVAAVVGAALFFYFSEFEWREIQEWIAALPVLPLLALMVVLPPFGFSVSVVYLVAGARFGPWVGAAVIAGVTALHLLLMHWIARSFLRAPLERLLERRHHHLPRAPAGENVSLAVMAAVAPGLPYFSRNYLLALADVPLRVYFWVCLPLYVLRSQVSVFIGDLARTPDARQLGLLAVVYAVKVGVCAYVIWRIRRRLRVRRRAA